MPVVGFPSPDDRITKIPTDAAAIGNGTALMPLELIDPRSRRLWRQGVHVRAEESLLVCNGR
jgi:hypothetical protein